MKCKEEVSEKIYQELYDSLNEEIAKIDCAVLCADKNGGIPFCCDSENAVPLLYCNEHKMLKKRTDLWQKWKPKNKHEEKLLKDETDTTFFFHCSRPHACERENRSITCRTFPLEPYFDTRAILVGLVFISDFVGSCPLTLKKNHSLIRQEFIDQHFEFWDRFTDLKEEEFDTYYDSSKSLRRSRGQTKKDFKIFFPTKFKKMEKKWKKYI